VSQSTAVGTADFRGIGKWLRASDESFGPCAVQSKASWDYDSKEQEIQVGGTRILFLVALSELTLPVRPRTRWLLSQNRKRTHQIRSH